MSTPDVCTSFNDVQLKPRAQFLGWMLILALDLPGEQEATWSWMTSTAHTKDVPELPLFPAFQAFEPTLQGRNISQFTRQILKPRLSQARGDSEVCVQHPPADTGAACKKDYEIHGARELHTFSKLGTCFCSLMVKTPRKRVTGSSPGF